MSDGDVEINGVRFAAPSGVSPSPINEDGVSNYANQDGSTNNQAYQEAHGRSDIDSATDAQHHTLGFGPNQAMPGNANMPITRMTDFNQCTRTGFYILDKAVGNSPIWTPLNVPDPLFGPWGLRVINWGNGYVLQEAWLYQGGQIGTEPIGETFRRRGKLVNNAWVWDFCWEGTWWNISLAGYLGNGWVNYDNSNTTGRFLRMCRRDGWGQLQGVIKSGTVGLACITLPTEWRPEVRSPDEFILPCISNGAFGIVTITASSGFVAPNTGSNIYFDMGSVRWKIRSI